MRRTMLTGVLCVLACSRPDPKMIAPDPAPAVSSAPPAPSVEPPKVPSVYCENDAECGWDDACFPKTCVGKSKTAAACEESGPRPGSCTCIENLCTLLRKTPSSGAAATGCKSNDECAFEPATGSCAKGSSTPIRSHGAFCACTAGTCTPEIVGPVTCKTTKDCSWLEHPMRPAPASKVPRLYPPIVPCKTGEHESACVKGVCEIQVWKC